MVKSFLAIISATHCHIASILKLWTPLRDPKAWLAFHHAPLIFHQTLTSDWSVHLQTLSPQPLIVMLPYWNFHLVMKVFIKLFRRQQQFCCSVRCGGVWVGWWRWRQWWRCHFCVAADPCVHQQLFMSLFATFYVRISYWNDSSPHGEWHIHSICIQVDLVAEPCDT